MSGSNEQRPATEPSPQIRPIQTNFTAGELSPLLYGRVDLDRYGNGAQELVNVTVRTQGGVTRRTGTYFMTHARYGNLRCRLVPFEASEQAAYVLEFGEQYVRFHYNRAPVEVSPGVPLQLGTPYQVADLRRLRFAQSADVLFICHPDYPPQRISRLGTTSFVLEDVQFSDGPWQDENLTTTALKASHFVGTISIEASAPVFTADDVGRQLAIRDEVPARVPDETYNIGAVFYAVYNQTYRLYRVVLGGKVAAADMTTGIEPAWDKNSPTGENDTVRDGTAVLKYLGRGKAIWGNGLITGVTSGTLVTVDVVDPMPSTVFAVRWRLGEWGGSRGWPRCMTFHSGRSVWAGSIGAPQTIWMSETGDFYSMSPSEEDGAVLDTNAITYTLDDDKKNTIQWMSSFNRGLLLGTPSGEFVVSAPNASSAISPSNFEAKRVGDRGSAVNTEGARVGSSVLYLSTNGRRLREFTYDFGSDGYKAPDLSVLSEHITGTGIVEWDYQEEPEGIVWMVRADGVLVSLTYDQEQQVRAWCRHNIGGPASTVESIAVVADPYASGEDIYLSVRRIIAGQEVRHIEWIGPTFDGLRYSHEDAYFVDCGLTYSGPPTTTFGGLSHLEGETVMISAAGATRPPAVVTGGTVTIAAPAVTKAHIGLSYLHRVVTLRPEYVVQGRSAQGARQRISRIVLRVLDCVGGRIGNGSDGQFFFSPLPPNPVTGAAPLFNGDIPVTQVAGWSRSAQIYIESIEPQPFTLTALITEVQANA